MYKRQDQYILIVHQGNSVFTVFFRDLDLETHLFNYGKTGHFWVKAVSYTHLDVYKRQVKEMAETAHKSKRRVSVSGMLKHLGVSRSGYHAWLKRVPSNTEKRREAVKMCIRDRLWLAG